MGSSLFSLSPMENANPNRLPVKVAASSDAAWVLLQPTRLSTLSYWSTHVLLVFHGAINPPARNGPGHNELVREAIRGMESSALKERARHETILPFTRLLAGPADYTAMLSSTTPPRHDCGASDREHRGLAAPLLTIAAQSATILDNPAVEAIKSVAPVWDETIVLPSS